VAVRIPDLRDTGDDRNDRTSDEEEHGNHEAPEVHLLAAPIGVLHARIETRRGVTPEQEQLVAGIGKRVDAL